MAITSLAETIYCVPCIHIAKAKLGADCAVAVCVDI